MYVHIYGSHFCDRFLGGSALKVKLEYSNHRFREEEKKQFISETDAGADPMHALRAELLPTRRPSRLMSDSFAGKNMILRGKNRCETEISNEIGLQSQEARSHN